MMIRILVADDHPIVREGLKQILTDTPDIVIAGEATSGQEVLSSVLNNHYDVVLLDISMPGSSGFDVLKKLRSLKRKLPILVLTIHPESQYAARVLKTGASGYLTKDRAPGELIDAIRKVADGGKYITPSVGEILAFNQEVDTGKPIHDVLSNREYEVLCMIAQGKTVRDISEELLLSVKTVSTHRSHILTKMKMKNNAELIRYAINNNLV